MKEAMCMEVTTVLFLIPKYFIMICFIHLKKMFSKLLKISFISVVYKDFILAANKSDDIDFLKFEFVDTLLRAVGIEQEYAFSDQIREKYFHEDQIGNLTAMTPGAIDVSTKFTSFKIIHCTYH